MKPLPSDQRVKVKKVRSINPLVKMSDLASEAAALESALNGHIAIDCRQGKIGDDVAAKARVAVKECLQAELFKIKNEIKELSQKI